MPELIGKGFRRVNEAVSPELLADDELFTLTNMVLDEEMGVPTSRKGWSLFNSNAVDSSGSTISLHDLVDKDGDNYLLASITTKLRKSKDGTASFSDVKTGLTTGLKTRVAPLGDGFYLITNGTDAPFVIGGSDFASEYTLGILQPNVEGASCPEGNYGAGGNLDASSHYEWIIVNVTDRGECSPPSLPFTTSINEANNRTTDASNKQVYFKTLPVTSADDRVKYRKIYRTQGLDTYMTGGRIFYYLKTISASETFFTDGAADTDLDAGDYILFYDVPSKVKYICNHKGRLFLGYVTVSKTQNISPANSKTGVAPSGFTIGISFGASPTAPTGVGATGCTREKSYQWIVTFLDEDGNESYAADSSIYSVPAGAGTVIPINLVALPLAGQEPYNKPIVARKIYRTTADMLDGKFYLVTTQDSTGDSTHFMSTAYTDNTNDADLGAAYTTAGTQTYKSAIMWSEINAYANILESSILQVNPDDGDEITGIFDDEDGVLIFKKYSIYKLYTTGNPLNWRLIKVSENIGCTDDNCILKNGKEYLFVSNKIIYLLNESGLKNISELFKTTLSSITSWKGVTYYPQQDWYVLAGLATATYYILIYDRKTEGWYLFYVTEAGCVALKQYGTSAGTLLVGDNKYVVKYDTTVTSDSETGGARANFLKAIRTKTYIFGEGIGRIRLRKLWSNYNKANAADIAHSLTDPHNSGGRTWTDSTNSGETIYEQITDSGTGSMTLAQKLYYTIQGTGLLKFYGFKLAYLIKRLGRRWS